MTRSKDARHRRTSVELVIMQGAWEYESARASTSHRVSLRERYKPGQSEIQSQLISGNDPIWPNAYLFFEIPSRSLVYTPTPILTNTRTKLGLLYNPPKRMMKTWSEKVLPHKESLACTRIILKEHIYCQIFIESLLDFY